jgi:hypothetical protein
MALHGKTDHAGRLLSEEQRMAAYPNHPYWQGQAKGLINWCQEHLSDAELAAVDAVVDSLPEDVSWMAMYRRLERWNSERQAGLRMAPQTQLAG